MSGGSYGYLCHKDARELLQSGLHELYAMQGRLMHLGFTEEASAIMRVYAEADNVNKSLEKLDAEINAQSEVWQAVEWKDSGDGSRLFDEIKAKYDAIKNS